MSRTSWLIGISLLTLAAGANAGETSGVYMTFVRSFSDTPMADGTHARVIHYHQATTSDKADSPLAGKTSECVGRMIVSSAGKVVSGHGFCFSDDGAGNGASWSWRVEEAGTPKCPQMCGTFKWLEGYGNTKSATAAGTFMQTQAGKDGGVGTYTVKY